jgi:hypothetical protein
MNIGRRRRALSARSMRPLPRIGSDEAVPVITMSNSAMRAGRSASAMASASKRCAKASPRASVRLATTIAWGRCATK